MLFQRAAKVAVITLIVNGRFRKTAVLNAVVLSRFLIQALPVGNYFGPPPANVLPHRLSCPRVIGESEPN